MAVGVGLMTEVIRRISQKRIASINTTEKTGPSFQFPVSSFQYVSSDVIQDACIHSSLVPIACEASTPESTAS